jgi:hypothetical protein
MQVTPGRVRNDWETLVPGEQEKRIANFDPTRA